MASNEINELLKKLPPFIQEGKKKTGNILTDAVVRYSSQIRYTINFENYSFNSTSEDIDRLVSQITQQIKNAEQHYLSGNIIGCYNTISDILFQTLKSFNLNHEIAEGNIFYRMRENDSGNLFSKEEMFHIPFELKRLVSNQRYSISGHPSLYAGKSIYVCWEELNRPKFDTANIVALKAKRKLNLLDLRMPTEIITENDLYRIPLIIACSVKTQDTSSLFKPEYIISQAILHSILNQNRTSSNCSKYDGIIYYSTQIGDNQRLFDKNELFENIVIPANNVKFDDSFSFGEGFCPSLCNHFEISNTVSHSIIQMTSQQGMKLADKFQNGYEMTPMGEIEKTLNNSNKWKDISPHKFFRLHPDELDKY